MVGYEEAAPSYTADYALTEARSSAAALSAFEITSYLADGATVTDSSEGSTFAFHYSALGGSLTQQEQRARLEQGPGDAEKAVRRAFGKIIGKTLPNPLTLESCRAIISLVASAKAFGGPLATRAAKKSPKDFSETS